MYARATEVPEPLPSFDDTLIELLKLFGITSPIILALVLFAFNVKSWIDALVSGKRIYGKSIAAATVTHRRIAAIGPMRIGLATLTTAIVIVAQLMTLALLLLAGALVSAVEELAIASAWRQPASRPAQNYRAFETAWTEHGFTGLLTPEFRHALVFDDFLLALGAVALVGLIGSYFASRGWLGWGLLMTLPLSIFTVTYGPFVLLALAVQDELSEGQRLSG